MKCNNIKLILSFVYQFSNSGRHYANAINYLHNSKKLLDL